MLGLLYFYPKEADIMYDAYDNKAVLDEFTLNALVDLYTTIAGITSGYISVVQRDFNMNKTEAQLSILGLDKHARAKVDEAYKIYDKIKEDRDE